MALNRRSGARFSTNIWPGFVDAMTALLLVLMFVLSIFMIMQFILQGQVTEKDRELDTLAGQISQLATALGLEQQRTDQLEGELGALSTELSAAEAQAMQQAALIATLTDQRDAQRQAIASFEEQVASLLAENRDLTGSLSATREDLDALQAENARQIDANEALNLALAQAREEIDADAEAARLAAARREALEALVADLRSRNAAQAQTLEAREAELAARSAELSEAEAARLAEAAAAERLRAELEGSSAELTAMTLQLEAERRRAEETLTLLAAARAAQEELAAERDEALSAAEAREALLAVAREQLGEEQALSQENQRQVELLNQQTRALNQQLRNLQGLLDESRAAEEAAQVRIESLGSDLNTALARVAQEQRRRADLEEAERKRLEEEAKNLENYRSEFFGRVREILGDREGIQVVGDRFVFSSEVLFAPGSATLGPEGAAQLAEVGAVIREIRDEIPPEIDWILRVDGHTDNVPISGGEFADNWELSQARALSVVKYLIEEEDIAPQRLSANGFGEFQPVDPADTPEARARNRRIELKFTER